MRRAGLRFGQDGWAAFSACCHRGSLPSSGWVRCHILRVASIAPQAESHSSHQMAMAPGMAAQKAPSTMAAPVAQYQRWLNRQCLLWRW